MPSVKANDLPDMLAIMKRPQCRPAFVSRGVLRGHALAELIPEMAEDEYIKLKDDIAERGLMEPVVLYEGQILDGRHRYRACREVGRGVDFTEYTGDDAAGYVVALNVHRRHLTASQKAVIALEVEKVYAETAKANMVEGGRISQDRETLSSDPVHATRKAAEAVGVSHSYVSDAKKVGAKAPDLLPAISSGTMTLPEAKREVQGRQKADLKLVKVAPSHTADQPDRSGLTSSRSIAEVTEQFHLSVGKRKLDDAQRLRREVLSLVATLDGAEQDEEYLDYRKVDPRDRDALIAELTRGSEILKQIIKILRTVRPEAGD